MFYQKKKIYIYNETLSPLRVSTSTLLLLGVTHTSKYIVYIFGELCN